MLREADELSQGSQILIEIVELMYSGTCSVIKSGKSIESTINPAVVGEIKQFVPRVTADGRNHGGQRMLAGMHMSRRAGRNATVSVGQVHERRRGAGGIAGVDGALVNVYGAGIEISRGAV